MSAAGESRHLVKKLYADSSALEIRCTYRQAVSTRLAGGIANNPMRFRHRK